MSAPETFEVEVVERRTLAPSVRGLRMRRVDARPMLFQAGQWLNLILPAVSGEIRRAYSIASPPDGTPYFELAVTRVEGGPGSQFLWDLAEGDMLRAMGPQGFFTRAPLDSGPALFVGTGTGVTPLRSMLLDAARRGSEAPMVLLLGVRREGDLLYREELEQLASTHKSLRLVWTLSQGSPEWQGARGYVQEHVPALFEELSTGAPAPPHVYVCGLEKMVKATRDLLRKQLGAQRQQVHSERYD